MSFEKGNNFYLYLRPITSNQNNLQLNFFINNQQLINKFHGVI